MKQKQKLELTWIGKENRPRLEPRILLEDPEKSYHAKQRVSDKDIFDNRLIFGDNLLALKALEQEFAGKVKCVFIDPPYNTGSAFTHYDDGIEHSIWLSLMRDRLELIRRLLSYDGSLWITIDAIVDAVPVRLMKRDLLFVVEHLAAMLDEHRLAIVLRQHGINKARAAADTPAKLLAGFVRKADESTLGHLLMEIVILHSTHSPTDSGKVLKEAAEFYKVDVNSITAKVKQEFAAKDKAKATKEVTPKPSAKAAKGARAA